MLEVAPSEEGEGENRGATASPKGALEEGYMVGLMHRQRLHGTRETSNGGRVRVRIIHGLNISHKELTYLLQKSISYRNELLRACS